MTYFELPKDEMTGYSPKAFKSRIWEQAILQEIKAKEQSLENKDKALTSITDSKNKNKFVTIIENNKVINYTYGKITEMYYASIYAIAMNKKYNIKHEIISSDSPDIIFINSANPEDRIAIEVYEAYSFNDRNSEIIINEEEEVKKLYGIKGNKCYGIDTRLLIMNRIKSTKNGYNISKYIEHLKKYNWSFSAIILCVLGKEDSYFTFFYIYPEYVEKNKIEFHLEKDKEYWY